MKLLIGKINIKFQYFLVVVLSLLLISCELRKEGVPKSVTVVGREVNGVVISKNNKNLVVYGHPDDPGVNADRLLLTHCRRDLMWSANSIIKNGTNTYVPAKELDFFTQTDQYWNDFTHDRFGDYDQQTTKYPTTSQDISRTLKGGDILEWEDLEFRVLDTPGYTRGSISYYCEIDGKDVAFTGDLIYGEGKLFDLYSLQDKIEDLDIRGYHGFASRMAALIASLQTVKSLKPDIIVPSRGPVIHDPEAAIDKLIDRLQRLYSNYLSTTAFRWYIGEEKHAALADRVQLDPTTVDWMPLAITRDEDMSWFKHVNNSVFIESETGSVFLIDCGMQDTYEKIMDDNGILANKKIEGIFITHYHDDHTDYISEILKKYNCPVYVTRELEGILSNPGAYRMPAMTSKPIHNIEVVPDQHSIRWNEFKFTFYDFPGQTIYHNALLVETGKDKVLFNGDSFTPSGMDDYCILNRNIIREGEGYFYCLDVLSNMPKDTWLVNQHVQKLFHYSQEQLEFMKQKLRERAKILEEISPWEDINFLIDEQWTRFYPYAVDLPKGQSHKISIKIMNHQKEACTYVVKPNAGLKGLSIFPDQQKKTIPAGKETGFTFTLSTNRTIEAGVHMITADINYDDNILHEWCEGIVEVSD